jgi:radical SAM additional 4Fe4S-binding domain
MHIITNTNSDYKIVYFPESKRFFKVNDKAISLIKTIINETPENQICKEFNLIESDIELYKKRVNEYRTPITCIPESRAENDEILGRLVIHLANGCNLRCVYCYANGGTYHSSSAMLSKKTVDQIIDIFYGRYKRIIGLQFFGGEPLLNMEVMEYACQKFKEKDPEITFGIVTNGTLIDSEFIRIANQYQIHTTISYDGNYKVNNILRIQKNGNGTSDLILQKAKEFKEKTGLLDTIEATYTQYHYDSGISILDCIKHINEELPGVPVHLVPVSGSEESDFILKDYTPFVNSIDDFFKENEQSSQNNYTYSLMQRIVYGIVNKTSSCGYICDAGVSTLSVSVNGDLYPCFMFTDLENYRLGNIFDENLFESERLINKITAIREFSDKDKNEECKNCYIKNLCNSCLGLNSMNENTDKFVMDVKFCDMSRKMTEQILIHLAKLPNAGRND